MNMNMNNISTFYIVHSGFSISSPVCTLHNVMAISRAITYSRFSCATHHQNSNEILQFQNYNHVIDCSVQCRVETRNPGITVTN